jgi:hypothetical protein
LPNPGTACSGSLKKKCWNERTMGPSYLQEPMVFNERVSKEGVVLGSVIWRISKLMREPWSPTRTGRLLPLESWIWISVASLITAGGLFPRAPHSRKP